MTARSHVADTEALQTRLAARVAGALSARTTELPRDISERLRAAREQALSLAHARLQANASGAPSLVGRSAGGAALLAHPSSWWLKAAAGLPVLVLVAGLVLIDRWNSLEQVQAAAEIDAMLLADELPPGAYVDPGFVEYLKTPPQP